MGDLVFLFLFQFILTIPVVWKTRSFSRYVLASVISFFGIALPWLVFVGSSFLLPPSQEHCPHGWLDCFIQGKLALTPLALWATAALYAVDIFRVENRNRLWIIFGLSFGAIISAVCFLFVFFCLLVPAAGSLPATATEIEEGLLMYLVALAIPLYISVWYWVRLIQLARLAQIKPWVFIVSQIGSLPFWAAAYYQCRQTYLSLPDRGDGCFIVTAAGRGHASLVGPFYEITRHGQRRPANHQLRTFWELENRWRRHLPRCHAAFRLFYNRLGPVIATRIKSPWQADLIYLALKPLELTARCINRILRHENT